MSLSSILRITSDDAPLIAPGLHPAWVFIVALLGRQSTNFGEKLQVFLQWMLQGQMRTYTGRDGRRYTVPSTLGRVFTMSLHDSSALRPVLEAVLGRALTAAEKKTGFDVFTLGGLGCGVNVVHRQSNGRLFANVDSVVPASSPLGPMPGSPIYYNPDQHNAEAFARLPQWVQDAISRRIRKEPVRVEPAAEGDAAEGDAAEFDDSIPF